MNRTITFSRCQNKSKFTDLLQKYLLGIILLFSGQVYSQTITNVTVSPTSVCAGSTVTVTFTASSSNGNNSRFDNATNFAPFLSTSAGVFPGTTLTTFTNPSSIPVLPATAANGEVFLITTTITIPSGTTPGTTYKISIGTTNLPLIAGNATTPTTNKSANFSVVAPAVGGTITGSAAVCSGTNSTTFTLSGQTGSVSKWQYATVSDFSSGVVDVVNATNTLTAANLTATRYYRAVVVSGSCSENSSTGTVTVNPLPAGTLTNGGAVCAGTQPQLTFTASAGTGPFTLVINGQTYIGRTSGVAFTATGSAPTATTSYNLTNITGVNCTNTSSASTSVTVNPLPAGTLTNGGAVCSGTQPQLTFTASAGTGPFTLVINGQTYTGRTSGVAFTATGTAPTSTTTYNLTNITGINCTNTSSTSTSVTVNPLPAGTLTNGGAVCSGTQPQLTFTASAGTGPFTLVINGQTYTGKTSGVAFTATGTVPTATTTYNLTNITGVNCTNTSSTSTSVTVNQLPAGTLTNGGTVCSGTQPQLTFTSTAGTGPFDLVINGQTYTGRTSGVAFTATGTAPTATTTYNLTNITGVNCTNTSSASTSVTVTPINTVGAASSTPTLCMDTVLTDITHTTTGATGIGSATGLPTGVTASWASNTITISGTPTASGTFNYTIPLTGGCGSVDAIGTITVSSQITWTGSVSTAWSNNANWSCGIAPGTGSDVSIGTASFYPEINSNVIINSLTLNSGTTIVVNSLYNLTVTGAIVNNGTLTIENNGNLIQVNNVANTGAGSTVVKRESNPLIRLDYMAWSSPVSGQGLLDFSPLTTITPSVRFYTYNTTTDLYNSISSGAINTEQFSTGKGYLIRLPFNHPTAQATWNGAFTGNPHNGDYSVGVSTAGNKYNLIGNPYPSPISISQFAADNNSNIETTLYFWRKTNNATSPSYCTWNTEFPPTFAGNGESYASTPNDVIRTGQGFIVQAKTGVTSVEFNNNQRIADNANQIFRNSNNSVQLAPSTIEANRIWLNLIGASSGYSQAVVGYFTNATEGVDNFDSKFFNDGPVALTTVINNQDYVIQGRSLPFLASDVVPLKYKVTNSGSYSIAIDHVDGIFANGQMVYLRDNSNGVLHDLSTGAYTFTSAAGTFASRFDIVYQMQLSTNTEIFTENQLITYTEDSNLVIQSTGDLIKTVAIFDLRGRLITSQNEVNNSIITLPLNINNQVLLVKVTSVNGVVVTKKVMF